MDKTIAAIGEHFAVAGTLTSTEPFHGGHINDSYVLTFQHAGRPARYLLQRINAAIFKNPAQVMENIRRVTEHIAKKLAARGLADVSRHVLTLVPARAAEGAAEKDSGEHAPAQSMATRLRREAMPPVGVPVAAPANDSGAVVQASDLCHCDTDGCSWRLYHFIENTRVYPAVQTPAQAYQAGRAFGEFQGLLADFAGPRLHEVIPDFHNTPLRYAALERAVAEDLCNRAAAAKAEIDFALARQSLAPVLLDLQRAGQMPERIVHNDAKISNVLLDEKTGEGLCVVDLDIVMPGLALYDFGDMVRSMATTAAEDEPDVSKVDLQPPLFEALARGYLETAGAFLNAAERAHLVFAGKLITLEQGVRFLTDFLRGDTYYKTQRPGQNLDRCRTQFRLVELIERQEAAMGRFVKALR